MNRKIKAIVVAVLAAFVFVSGANASFAKTRTKTLSKPKAQVHKPKSPIFKKPKKIIKPSRTGTKPHKPAKTKIK